MSPTGGATTVDFDGKGKIWVSAPDGALRFDPATETFTEFKSLDLQDAERHRHRPTAPPATATATAGGPR